jgi:hypothetical protein
MLQGLRAKVSGALHAALGDGAQHPPPTSTSASPPLAAAAVLNHDPRLARAEQLVAAATSDRLPPDTPDWGATLELVDMINADPP